MINELRHLIRLRNAMADKWTTSTSIKRAHSISQAFKTHLSLDELECKALAPTG